MNEGSHQTAHIHPSAWLSGVYYVAVPSDVRRNDPEHNGWLEFGPSDDKWHRPETVMPQRQIFPRPGPLVTFASYFWHRTRPLRSAKPRISFAFDMIPL